MSEIDAERRSQLLAVKLAALVSQHVGIDTSSYSHVPCALGTALVADHEVWILVDGDATRALGPAIAWSSQYATPIHLVADNHCGMLARRARGFTMPITVWHLEGSQMVPAIEEPHQGAVCATPRHMEFITQIAQAGADPLVEWGVVVGEVRGLEICRVVDDHNTGEARIEVGIGAHDRETYALVHQGQPIDESIASVVSVVAPHRSDGAPFHPYNHIAPERFARWRAMQSPQLLGFSSLTPVDPPVRRTNVKDSAPCVALGENETGNTTVVVFVHGIDVDVVAVCVDAAFQYSCAQAMIVARPQDVVPSLRTMAQATTMTTIFSSLS
jgi:hypothetical protein